MALINTSKSSLITKKTSKSKASKPKIIIRYKESGSKSTVLYAWHESDSKYSYTTSDDLSTKPLWLRGSTSEGENKIDLQTVSEDDMASRQGWASDEDEFYTYFKTEEEFKSSSDTGAYLKNETSTSRYVQKFIDADTISVDGTICHRVNKFDYLLHVNGSYAGRSSSDDIEL